MLPALRQRACELLPVLQALRLTQMADLDRWALMLCCAWLFRLANQFAAGLAVTEALVDEISRHPDSAVAQVTPGIPPTREVEILSLSWFLRAVCLKWLKRYSVAITACSTAIELDSRYGVFFFERAYSLAELRQHAEAIQDLTRAVELNPHDPMFWNNRGWSKQGLQQHSEAILDFTRAIELNNKLPLYFHNRAWSCQNLRQHAEAVEDLSAAIELLPTDSMYFNNRAWSLQNLQRLDEALADYNTAIAINPTSEMFYNNRSGLHRIMGNREQFASDRERLAKLRICELDHQSKRQQ
eukprot:TRINITY_DN21887_c0_g1_i1.p1 TRINITY_DN21887_c0_g1~~TRINITY_DN21887_c0_g1_i1.p1  ORF type:complete len:298 (-),score=58.29 TRINITY_DN21887_c0_g1_i1:11-904(-)